MSFTITEGGQVTCFNEYKSTKFTITPNMEVRISYSESKKENDIYIISREIIEKFELKSELFLAGVKLYDAQGKLIAGTTGNNNHGGIVMCIPMSTSAIISMIYAINERHTLRKTHEMMNTF